MIGDHRLVVCVPAGRRRYMDLLVRHVLRCPLVDELRLWMNTTDAEDIAWMETLEARDPRVSLHHPSWPHAGNYSIHNYFRACVDPKTVYVRLDDDIVWVGPNAIRRLAEKRLADRHPFLWYANVVNTGITSHLHQRAGRIPAEPFATYECMSPVGWADGQFAAAVHRAFLADPREEAWELTNWRLSIYERHSINAISWLGEDAARWAPTMHQDEEAWLSVEEPMRQKRPNAILGSALCVHAAFYPQRDTVDASGVLDGYRKLAEAL